MPNKVMHNPIMLIKVRISPNTIDEIKMVATSLNIPHTLSVTTDVRLIKKNSDMIMKKARLPPAKIMPI